MSWLNYFSVLWRDSQILSIWGKGKEGEGIKTIWSLFAHRISQNCFLFVSFIKTPVGFMMVIELSGAIQSDIILVISNSNKCTVQVWFEITSLISDQNCTTWSSINFFMTSMLKSQNLVAQIQDFLILYKYFIYPVLSWFEKKMKKLTSFSWNFSVFF